MISTKKLINGGILVLALLITVFAAIAAVPTVTLNTPGASATDTDGDVTFAFIAANSPTSCALYTDLSGSWAVDQTSASIVNGVNTFTKDNIADNSVFEWNVMCTNANGTAWGDSNRTLTIDINDKPVWVTTIDDQPNIQEDSGVQTIIADISSYVVDADTTDTITFTVQTEDTTKVDCAIDSNGHNLKITPASDFAGTATCKIRASDGSLYADDEFSITVANVQDAPTFSGTPDKTMVAGTSTNIDLSTYADDVDGDTLTYDATSADTSKLTVSVSGSSLTLSAVADVTGTVNVDLTATDGTEEATDSITVTIRAAETQLTLPTEVKAGGSSQDRGTTVTKSFEIENSGVQGDNSLTNLKVYFDDSNSFEGNVTFSTSSSGTYTSELDLGTIAPGNKQTVYAKVFIPEDAYGGVSTAGKIYVESNEKTDSLTLKVETQSGLVFKDLDIGVDEGEDKGIHDESDGYQVDKDAAPGTEVEVTFELENTFSDSDDIDISSIEVEVTLEDMGDESEQSETVDVEDIDSGDDSESYTVIFDVPHQLEEGKYDLTFVVEGEDDNDAKHRFTKTYEINVVKENYALGFTSDLIPEIVSCSRSAQLEIEVFNIGDRDVKNIDVTVKNTELDIDLKEEIDKLDKTWDDSDNNEKVTFTLDIPSDAEAKDYTFGITVYRDNKKETEASGKVILTVEDCSSGSTSDDKKDDIEVITPPTIQPPATNVDITDSLETPFTETSAFIILLIVGIVVVLALIILMLILSFRR